MSSVNLTLKLAIVATGKKQKRIAKLVGISETELSKIVHGLRRPSDEQQKKLSSFLGQPVASLFPEVAA